MRDNKILVKIKYFFKMEWLSKILLNIESKIKRPLVFSICSAILINLIIEILARNSIIKGFMLIIKEPIVFTINVLLILSVLVIGLLFKRRAFSFIFLSLLWLALGIINHVILSNRMTPFTTKDLSVLKDGLTIVPNYLSTSKIVLSIIGIVLIISILIIIFLKSPKKENFSYRKSILLVGICASLTFGSINMAIYYKKIDTFFGNLAYAYRDNGFAYCFLNTWLNDGISRPDEYNKNQVKYLMQKYNNPNIKIDKNFKPNIIMVQLESFIDPTIVKDFEYSKDPIPYFRSLSKKYSSGYVTVPAFGAGTANTEFEALTGISVKFFGPGEYPYKSILQKKTMESLPYDLRKINYDSHAIHNHRGAFYGRNLVFRNLGFDTFTSLEYMNNVEKTKRNWAKDNVLTQYILSGLKSSKNRDFIYTISVQGHGKYPEEKLLEAPEVEVIKAPTEILKNKYEYYVNQVYDMDKFVHDLTVELRALNEPTIAIFYGDHLPALEMKEDDIEKTTLFQTPYIMWDNIGLQKEDRDLYAYQLGSYMLGRAGIKNVGLVFNYHEKAKKDEHYKNNLKLIGYDMLYGKGYTYGKKGANQPSELKMGIDDIKINEVVNIGDVYYIKGENFTKYSKATIKDEILETKFLGPNLLQVKEELTDKDILALKISQVEKYDEVLSTTK